MASDAAASDDSDMRSIAHIGTIASAVGLAMGERLAAPGRDILAAMVLGYEIAGRVDEALTPGRMQRGFHGSVATIFGGAVTAGRLLQLDAERMTQAIVLAATSAGGLAIAADTSCAREYHAGLAALLGTQAALAAHAGFEGEPVLLDAPRGFFAAFNGQAVDEVARGLGDDWDIVTDMAIKLMPGAHPFHAIAEAAITAAIDGDVRPEAVRRIVIRAPQLDTWRKQAVQPHDLVGAAHSVPYFVAAAVVDRRFDWEHFTPEKMRDPAIASLLPRVEFERDPPPLPDRFPHRHGGTVFIERTDGSTVQATCTAPRGSGARGIDWADVDAKYRRLAPTAGLSAATVEQSLALLHDFEDAPSPAPLIELLRRGVDDRRASEPWRDSPAQRPPRPRPRCRSRSPCGACSCPRQRRASAVRWDRSTPRRRRGSAAALRRPCRSSPCPRSRAAPGRTRAHASACGRPA